MAEYENGDGIIPHIMTAPVMPRNQEQLLQAKEYIDNRSRKEWLEKYGEFHEEYITIQTQVYFDDVSFKIPSIRCKLTDQAGDVMIIMPRYHPPGVASSSTYSGKTPPTSIPQPRLPTADRFYCNLTQSIRTEALRRADQLEKEFDAQLWMLFHSAVGKGRDPELKKLGHTPASLYGSSKKTCLLAKDVFKDRIKAMSDPQQFKYGIWGFSEVEVDIVRGIIFVRYITGWWDRDKILQERFDEKRAELESARASRQIKDTLHDDLDA
jgi:hypothetical protein